MSSSLAAGAGAARAILERDLRVYLSYRARFFTRVLAAFFTLTLFFYISRLVRVGGFATPADYYAFVVVGLVILEVLQATLAVPAQLRQELVAGTFERLVLSPFGAVAATAAMMLFPVVLALALAVVMLAIGALVFGLPLTLSTAPLALPVALLGSVAFAAVGLIFAAVVVVFKQASSGLAFLTAGISLVSGVYFPVALLPGGVRWLADVQPFRPTIDLLRHLLVGAPLHGSVGATLAKLVGFIVVLVPVGLLGLRRALIVAQRRGTIIEY